MKTVNIPEQEYLKLKSSVLELQKMMQVMQAQLHTFKSLLSEKNVKLTDEPKPNTDEQPKLSWKRGSGKHTVVYIADDFTAPLEELKEYMV